MPEPIATGAASPVEVFQLTEIRGRESENNYTAPPRNPPHATASGAYQFIRTTWHEAASATGVGAEFEYAYQAPPAQQDANALWLLREYGINSSHAWKASGPYPAPAEIAAGLAAVAGMSPETAAPPQGTVTVGGRTWTWKGTAGAVLLGAGVGAGGMAAMPPPVPDPVVRITPNPGDTRLAEFKACFSSMRKAGFER